jgi:uncharacterized protein
MPKETRNTMRHADLPVVSVDEARRLLMGAQGLLDDPARPATAASVSKLIERMGFVQLDTISVVERAHHHILHSRMDGYRAEHLETLHHKKKRLFEHMTHDASLIPVKWFAHWRPRFERGGRSAWWREKLGLELEAKVAEVLSHIRKNGPRMAREFEAQPGRKAGAWWDWRPEKVALEYLCRRGELCVLSREKFQKVYELTERAYPEAHAQSTPNEQEHVEWACSTALERLGVASSFEVAAFWKSIVPQAAAAWCARAEEAGRIQAVLVEGEGGTKAKRGFAVADWRRRVARAPEPPRRMRLLSPFDPVVRDRKRLHRLFNFDYRFEAFVPAARRTHGYYVLPILEGERMVGRLDPKLDRNRGELRVLGLWWEPGVRLDRARRAAFEEAMDRFAQFVGAKKWTLSRSRPSAADRLG